jgi:hypothetical protein
MRTRYSGGEALQQTVLDLSLFNSGFTLQAPSQNKGSGLNSFGADLSVTTGGPDPAQVQPERQISHKFFFL